MDNGILIWPNFLNFEHFQLCLNNVHQTINQIFYSRKRENINFEFFRLPLFTTAIPALLKLIFITKKPPPRWDSP